MRGDDSEVLKTPYGRLYSEKSESSGMFTQDEAISARSFDFGGLEEGTIRVVGVDEALLKNIVPEGFCELIVPMRLLCSIQNGKSSVFKPHITPYMSKLKWPRPVDPLHKGALRFLFSGQAFRDQQLLWVSSNIPTCLSLPLRTRCAFLRAVVGLHLSKEWISRTWG